MNIYELYLHYETPFLWSGYVQLNRYFRVFRASRNTFQKRKIARVEKSSNGYQKSGNSHCQCAKSRECTTCKYRIIQSPYLLQKQDMVRKLVTLAGCPASQHAFAPVVWSEFQDFQHFLTSLNIFQRPLHSFVKPLDVLFECIDVVTSGLGVAWSSASKIFLWMSLWNSHSEA